MIQIKVIDFENLEIKEKIIKVDKTNALITKLKLKSVRNKIIDHLKDCKSVGLIKSIHSPKNKKLQEKLNVLVKAKRTIKKSLNQINQFYK